MDVLKEEQKDPTSMQHSFEGSVQELTCKRLPPDVSAWVELRAKAGYEKYGTYLSPNNGRNWLRDVAEELLDAAVYAECGALEGDEYAKELLHILVPIVSKTSTLFLSRTKA
jgi:hypothetical protein